MTLNGAIIQLVEMCENSMMPDLFKPYFDKVIETISECVEPSEIPHWIPCSERLPEELGDYLVSIKRVGWNCEEYVENDIAYWDDLEGFHKADKVIAWMPLPEPYRKDGEADG